MGKKVAARNPYDFLKRLPTFTSTATPFLRITCGYDNPRPNIEAFQSKEAAGILLASWGVISRDQGQRTGRPEPSMWSIGFGSNLIPGMESM